MSIDVALVSLTVVHLGHLEAVNYFCNKAPSQMFERVLNTPLSNVAF